VVAFLRVGADQAGALGRLDLVAGLDADGGGVEVGVAEPDGFAFVLAPDDDYPRQPLDCPTCCTSPAVRTSSTGWARSMVGRSVIGILWG